MKTYICLTISALMLTACSGVAADPDSTYPIDPEHARAKRHGSLTGEGGIRLFGGSDRRKRASAESGGAVSVNSYLWKATLDTVSFMPLASTDPFGGVIITDWYESKDTPGERFKLHVVIKDRALRSDAVQVNVFKQMLDAQTHQWRDTDAKKGLGREFEDIILTRARELKVKQG